MARMLYIVVLLGLLHCVVAQERQTRELIDTVQSPPISFFWQLGSNNIPQRGMERCSQPWSLAIDNGQSPAETTFPLYLTLFPVGGQPTIQSVMEGPQLGFFNWEASLPVGTNFSIGMTDSSVPTNSGGVVDGFYIVDGYDNCTNSYADQRALTTTIEPADFPCDEIAVRVSGGKAPYVASFLSGTSGLYGNVSNIATSSFSLDNTIPSGQQFTLFITDAENVTSNISSIMTSGLGATNCNRLSGTNSGDGGTPLGAVIGGAVGGVIGAILLALLAWWLLRRRSDRVNQQYAASELASKGEFRMADGTVPLVQPFVVPHFSSDSEITPSPTSAHPSFSPQEYNYGSPYGPPLTIPPSAYSATQTSPTSPVSQRNYPAYNEESPFHSHPYESTTGSTLGIALADPEEFAYREAGTWTSTPSLPRGAAPPSA